MILWQILGLIQVQGLWRPINLSLSSVCSSYSTYIRHPHVIQLRADPCESLLHICPQESPATDNVQPQLVIVGPDGNSAHARGAFDPATETRGSVSAASGQDFPTHITLTSGTKAADPLTKWGRQLLEETIGVDTLTKRTNAIKTVTFKSDTWTFCGCTEVFAELSEEAKALDLDTVILHHTVPPSQFDRDCPLDSYRWCLLEGELPLKAKHFVVLNDMGSYHPTTFIMSSHASKEGEESCVAHKYTQLVEADNEKIHIGMYNPTDTDQTEKAPVTPHYKFMTVWSDMAVQSAPQSVLLVDVALNSQGRHPGFGSRVSLIDHQATKEAIKNQLARFPGLSAERKRSGNRCTQYDFVDRETFDFSTEGRVLAECQALV